MKTVILTEKQVKNLIDGVLLEQNETKKESITVNFGAVWPMGKWKLTPQQGTTITNQLVQITNFINQHKGSTVKIQIEAGESRVTNKDNEVTPPVTLEPGVLSQKRGQSMKNFLTSYFQSLVGKAISQNDLPVIPEPKTVIGNTAYSGPKDLQDKSKVALYNQEQFVRAVVTAEKNYECIVGLEITIGYFPGKSRAGHECDEAIFELRMNGVSLGEANLNNSTLDRSIDITRERNERSLSNYNKAVERVNKKWQDIITRNPESNTEREKKKYMKEFLPEKPQDTKLPNIFNTRAQKFGFEDVNQYVKAIDDINNSFKSQGRKSEGLMRSQTFVLDGAKAKAIIDNAPSDKIILSIIPLVSKDGKYKLFYTQGSHADTPWVTIKNPKISEPLYDGEPNISLKRGSTQETVLLTTDLCGNPPQAVKS